MQDYVENFQTRLWISFHPMRVDFHAMANDPNAYARKFKDGFRRAEVDLSRLAQAMTQAVWSPCIWRGGVRLESHFLGAQWCALDFDSPEVSLAQAIRNWADTVHVIGTTKSHQLMKKGVQCDRFRIVVPFDRSIRDLHTYRHNMTVLIDSQGSDKSGKDGARLFYPCMDIVSVNAEGYLQPVQTPPPPSERRRAPTDYPEAPLDEMTTVMHRMLNAEIASGRRNSYCFAFAIDCAERGISKDRVWDLIRKSPTYRNMVMDDHLVREIWGTIHRGFRRVGRGD